MMSKITSQVWDKKYPENELILVPIQKIFWENLEKKGKIMKEKFEEKLMSCGDNLERIKVTKEFYEWTYLEGKTNETNAQTQNKSMSVLESEVVNYQKSKSISTEFRQRGNEFYKIREFRHALKAYNLALSFSPFEEIAVIYGNRSAVFVEMHNPLLALKDIRRSLSYSYPAHLKDKLLERKHKCLKILKLEGIETDKEELDKTLMTLWTQNVNKLDEEMEIRNTFCRKNLFRLNCKNPLITSGEDFIKIENTKDRGRHVVVTKSVQPGTLIIVDEPFSKILLHEVTWDLEHCHYCHQQKCDTGIPCRYCVFAFYCSDKCLEAAWKKFHQYECKCTPYLHLLKSPRTVLLAFRIICSLGWENLRDQFTQQDKMFIESKDKILGSDEDGVYNSASYSTIRNLISHPNQHNFSEMLSYCLTSLSLVSILENNSSLFNLCYTENISIYEFHCFVASLILLHMQNLPCNAHSLNELVGLKDDTEWSSDVIRNASCMEYGAGAFALLSLINHSCDPNVYRLNLYSGHTAVLTIRCLKPGDEVLDNYGSHYAIDDIVERKKHLYKNYSFECNCVACSNKWPLLLKLRQWSETFVCSYCNNFKLSEKYTSEYIEKCVVKDGQNHCKLCRKQFKTTRVIELKEKIDTFFCAYEMVLQNQPLQALNQLKECLTYFEDNLLPPFIRTNDTQETWKQALNLIAHSQNVFSISDSSLNVKEQHEGKG